jgi:hypothetical protein
MKYLIDRYDYSRSLRGFVKGVISPLPVAAVPGGDFPNPSGDFSQVAVGEG